jgi:alpha,alpha-trehalase
LLIEGLRSYGHGGVAREIAETWVKTVAAKFEETGFIYEKYNVLDPGADPVSAVYPDQRGFAWTNATTLRLIRDYSLN